MGSLDKDRRQKDREHEPLEPWLFQGAPGLVAHRGYAQNFPENTLSALKAAVAEGVHFIEFDVQLSKDEVPFLIHDDNLLRTAGLDVSVFDLNISQLSEVSVGQRDIFGDSFLSDTPPVLQTLSSQLNAWPHVHSFIEVKNQSVERFGVEKVVGQVLQAIDSLTARHSIISFSEDVLRETQNRSDKSVGWVMRSWDEYHLQLLEELSPEFVFFNFRKIPAGVELPRVGSHWALYDIGDPATAMYWWNRGASLIETMAVESMLEALRGNAASDE